MAKFIEMVRLVTNEDEVQFQSGVAKIVGDLQREGYEIDIDYKPMQGGFSALITAFKTYQNSNKFPQIYEKIVKEQQEQQKKMEEFQKRVENGELTEEEIQQLGLKKVEKDGKIVYERMEKLMQENELEG